jgi:hypothetical protein
MQWVCARSGEVFHKLVRNLEVGPRLRDLVRVASYTLHAEQRCYYYQQAAALRFKRGVERLTLFEDRARR